MVGFANRSEMAGADIPLMWSVSEPDSDSQQRMVAPLLANGLLTNGTAEWAFLTVRERGTTVTQQLANVVGPILLCYLETLGKSKKITRKLPVTSKEMLK